MPGRGTACRRRTNAQAQRRDEHGHNAQPRQQRAIRPKTQCNLCRHSREILTLGFHCSDGQTQANDLSVKSRSARRRRRSARSPWPKTPCREQVRETDPSMILLSILRAPFTRRRLSHEQACCGVSSRASPERHRSIESGPAPPRKARPGPRDTTNDFISDGAEIRAACGNLDELYGEKAVRQMDREQGRQQDYCHGQTDHQHNSPISTARPPIISTRVVNHASRSGMGVPIVWRTAAKVSGPRENFAYPCAIKAARSAGAASVEPQKVIHRLGRFAARGEERAPVRLHPSPATA